MAQFEQAIVLVLDSEGGFQNQPEDWGNYNAYDSEGNLIPYNQRKGNTLRSGTNRGISTALYSSLKQREVSEEEIRMITEQEAVDIYYRVYWNGIHGDHIENQKVANLIFDSYVNHGRLGKMIVQRVLNHLGFELKEDGIIGERTMEAINSADPATFHDTILDARILKYKELAANREGNDRYLNGWLKRLEKYPRMKTTTSVQTQSTPPTNGTNDYQVQKPVQIISPNAGIGIVAALLFFAYINDN